MLPLFWLLAPLWDYQEISGGTMSPTLLFQLHLILGYFAWALCFATYLWPRLRGLTPLSAHRAIAT